MRAGQTMYDQAGNQVALFPLEYMDISQGEGGSYSHSGRWAIDFLGYENGVRKLKCPYYAPFDCHVVQHASYYNVWQSDNRVVTPAGLQFCSFVVMHDDDPPPLGTYKLMGEEIGKTGTKTSQGGTPVTGDHVHMSGCNGKFAGWINGGRDLANRQHLYNLFYINDTIIIDDYGYNWRIYEGGQPGPSPTPDYRKYHFKWVLYANKIRARNQNII